MESAASTSSRRCLVVRSAARASQASTVAGWATRATSCAEASPIAPASRVAATAGRVIGSAAILVATRAVSSAQRLLRPSRSRA
ncbi:MAG: hypothetical protein CVU56_00755 [Deltaproteobacteria bacterium HGW-Deltaproteobacteria-14]|nr:MAG: hypothetical protein CVU56_00755 [Deltaproteobacteria bacterium HGW-Deltaproteobacteria-14]